MATTINCVAIESSSADHLGLYIRICYQGRLYLDALAKHIFVIRITRRLFCRNALAFVVSRSVRRKLFLLQVGQNNITCATKTNTRKGSRQLHIYAEVLPVCTKCYMALQGGMKTKGQSNDIPGNETVTFRLLA